MTVQLSHLHFCNLHFILVLTRYDRQMLYFFLGTDYFNRTTVTERYLCKLYNGERTTAEEVA